MDVRFGHTYFASNYGAQCNTFFCLTEVLYCKASFVVLISTPFEAQKLHSIFNSRLVKAINIRRSIALVCVVLLWPAQAYEQPKEMVFRMPDPSPITDYAVTVITEVYTELGIEVRFVEMPRDRSLTEANKGHISGELGRLPQIGEEFPNLLRVDFPLFDSRVVLVADRRECGLCNFESIRSYAYFGGTQSVENVISAQSTEKPSIKAVSFEQLEMLYENDRVEAVVVNDFEAKQLRSIDDPYTIIVPYTRNTGYHFLYKDHAALVPKIEAILRRMAASGRINEIAETTGAQMLAPQVFRNAPKFGLVRATAGLREDYTELEGQGYYWKLMRKIFDSVTSDLELLANSHPRAYLGYVDERFDIFVADYTVETPQHSIASRNHIDFDNGLYLFARDQETLTALKAGEHPQPICHIRSYLYTYLFPSSTTFYAADDNLDCFAMLDMGRVAGVIDYSKQAPEWGEIPYVSTQIRNPLPLHLMFHNNPRGNRMRDWFDSELRRLVESGEIAEIYSEEMLKRSKFDLNMPKVTPSQGPQ